MLNLSPPKVKATISTETLVPLDCFIMTHCFLELLPPTVRLCNCKNGLLHGDIVTTEFKTMTFYIYRCYKQHRPPNSAIRNFLPVHPSFAVSSYGFLVQSLHLSPFSTHSSYRPRSVISSTIFSLHIHRGLPVLRRPKGSTPLSGTETDAPPSTPNIIILYQ